MCSAAGCGRGDSFEKKDAGGCAYDRRHREDGGGGEKEGERKRTEQSFFVPKEEIVENDYDLSINKYKEIEYIPVEYPPTEEILKDIEELEVEIHKNLVELRKMLEENDE